MPQAKAPAKSPRPMYSGSRVFEKAYATFVNHVMAERIFSLQTLETPEDRILILAGETRLRCSKKTGLLRWESLTGANPDEPGAWTARTSSPIPHFWANNKELEVAVQYAWWRHLKRFVPPAPECFPKLTKKDDKKYISVEAKWNTMMDFASDRRLGSRERRRILVRSFAKALWNFLPDRDTLRLCHAYFGRKASFEEYNFTVRRAKELRARAAETPNLTRLIGEYIRGTAALRTGRRVLPPDILAQARAHLFRLPDVVRLGARGRWTDVLPPESLMPAGWRFLAGCTGAETDRLWQGADRFTRHTRTPPGAVLARVLNMLAKTGERPPMSFLCWAVEELPTWSTQGFAEPALAQIRETTVRFLRLAAQQAIVARRRGQLKRFLRGDLQLAWDWFRSQGRDEGAQQEDGRDDMPLVLGKQATWASVMRGQHAWHATRDERERRRREANQQAYHAWQTKQDAQSWESPLCAIDVARVHAVPLTTGRALREEGEQMNHCVGSYVDYCVSGHSRIFALARGDERATVELVKSGKRDWKVRQVFGPRNSAVSKPIATAAKELAKQYALAERAQSCVSGPSAR